MREPSRIAEAGGVADHYVEGMGLAPAGNLDCTEAERVSRLQAGDVSLYGEGVLPAAGKEQ